MFSSSISIYFFSLIYGSWSFVGEYKLKIYINNKSDLSHVAESVNSTLELTCQIDNFTRGSTIKLNWITPKFNDKGLVDTSWTDHENGSLKLTLYKLKEDDKGNYTCEALVDGNVIKKESVFLHIKQKGCVNMFECLSQLGTCIHHRYVCDGHKDCDNGLDESMIHCGSEPCRSKILCPDGRCIPSSWCCHPWEPNCTARIRLPCCPPLPQEDYLLHQTIMNNQHYTEMTFLQSTIYTIVGFAMVFMSIVTILMIAICRIHLQRSLISSVPRRPPISSSRVSNSQRVGGSVGDRGVNSRMLVSYSISNNGLEIVGDPCQPPPYSEISPYSDPPPPYIDVFTSRPDEESERSPCLSFDKPPP